MLCYIKDFKSFKTIAKYDAVSYALPDGVDGSITIYHKTPAELTRTIVGTWLVINDGFSFEGDNISYSVTTNSAGGYDIEINDPQISRKDSALSNGGKNVELFSKQRKVRQRIYYVSECTPNDDSIELKIVHPIYAFDRPVIYTNETTYGTAIYNILLNNYGSNCPDSEYLMSCLSISNSDSTECVVETDEYGYVVPCDLFEQARKDGVAIDFSIGNNETLKVDIYSTNYKIGVIVFGDGHSQLQSESYDASYCTKATIIYNIGRLGDLNWENKTITGSGAIIDDRTRICSDLIELEDKTSISISSENGFKHDIEMYSKSGTHLGSSQWQEKENKYFYSSGINIRLLLAYSNNASITPEENRYLTCSIAVAHDYYLSTENEISSTPPSNRAHGKWKYYTASENESPLYVAIGAFSHNSDNHKIEFYSDQYFEYYQPVRLRLRNEVFDTIITSRVHRNTDDRYYYTCGNLATTLTDKLKKIEKN